MRGLPFAPAGNPSGGARGRLARDKENPFESRCGTALPQFTLVAAPYERRDSFELRHVKAVPNAMKTRFSSSTPFPRRAMARRRLFLRQRSGWITYSASTSLGEETRRFFNYRLLGTLVVVVVPYLALLTRRRRNLPADEGATATTTAAAASKTCVHVAADDVNANVVLVVCDIAPRRCR